LAFRGEVNVAIWGCQAGSKPSPMSYNSALARTTLSDQPPATSTWPFASKMAACASRPLLSEPVLTQPAAGAGWPRDKPTASVVRASGSSRRLWLLDFTGESVLAICGGENQRLHRTARSIWRVLLPLSDNPRIAKAPASWAHSKRSAQHGCVRSCGRLCVDLPDQS